MEEDDDEKPVTVQPPLTSTVTINAKTRTTTESENLPSNSNNSGVTVFARPFSNQPTSGGMLDVQFPMRSSAQIVGNNQANTGSREKVALPPGHSPLDWAASAPSQPGLNRKSQISLDELAKHNTERDLWMAVDGVVYDATRYLNFHPGGPKMLMKGAGKDATALIGKIHPWINVHRMLEKYKVGNLI